MRNLTEEEYEYKRESKKKVNSHLVEIDLLRYLVIELRIRD